MTASAQTSASPHRPVVRRRSPLPLLIVLLAVAAAGAASIGAVSIPFPDMLSGNLSDQQEAVLLGIRLPRVLLAVVVGAGLAVSGAALQGLFRNPLADPGLIGIASGAALAVAMVIVLAGPLTGLFGLYGLAVAAFCGGVGTCILIFRITRMSGAFSVTYMLLSGIAINAIAMAGTGFMTYLSDDQQLRALTFWTMGSLGGALWPAVIVVATVVVPAILVLIRNAGEINILLLGEEEARHLGVDSDRLKLIIVLCAAFSVGAAVAVSGIIGFVGLVGPHIARLAVGEDHRFYLPASALAGAVILSGASLISKSIVPGVLIPDGIVTALIGIPLFLGLLMTQKRRG